MNFKGWPTDMIYSVILLKGYIGGFVQKFKMGHWGYISYINSLDPGRRGGNFKSIVFKLIIQNGSLDVHCENAVRWMQQNTFDDKSTLI